MTVLEKATRDVVLKPELLLLHILCQELQNAQLLHSEAISSGFRTLLSLLAEAEMVVMAVQSAHCLEVPLTHKGKLMVSKEYIEFLIHIASQNMEENSRRINRFYKHLELALETAASANNAPPGDEERLCPVY
ncbi:TYW3 protein, partial [Rhinopomastus cyanomelas]|nr:TYW3 protein [Rhinopomastus cyanomelas]